MCDEKWTKGHKCKEKKLFMLVAEDDNMDMETQVISVVPEEIDTLEEGNHSCFEISLQALLGNLNPSTLRLRGIVQHKPVMILVDSGSTHSFIDAGFSQRISLPVCDSKPFEVQVANGEKLSVRGYARKWS